MQPGAPWAASGVAKGTIEVVVAYPQSLQDNPSANFTETDFDSVLLALREVINIIDCINIIQWNLHMFELYYTIEPPIKDTPNKNTSL